MQVYVIGSLRNENIPVIAEKIRAVGFTVFDDWYSAGPEADDNWKKHQQYKGLSYKEALAGPAARAVFKFDKRNLDASDIAVLVLPAGKSGHLELGYCAGSGKHTYVLFDGEPENDRWDVMYQFATAVCFSFEDLAKELSTIQNYITPGIRAVPRYDEP